MTDLSRSTYSGEFGFLIVDPAGGDPGRYDREVMLAAHHWEGSWVSMQDMRKGPPPDNGLEVMYKAATLAERMLGHGEPIRVRQGRAGAVSSAQRQRQHGYLARAGGASVHRHRARRQSGAYPGNGRTC